MVGYGNRNGDGVASRGPEATVTAADAGALRDHSTAVEWCDWCGEFIDAVGVKCRDDDRYFCGIDCHREYHRLIRSPDGATIIPLHGRRRGA
jgi:hypothetical protein